MRIILANLPTMIGLVIVALYGLYLSKREREDQRRQRPDR